MHQLLIEQDDLSLFITSKSQTLGQLDKRRSVPTQINHPTLHKLGESSPPPFLKIYICLIVDPLLCIKPTPYPQGKGKQPLFSPLPSPSPRSPPHNRPQGNPEGSQDLGPVFGLTFVAEAGRGRWRRRPRRAAARFSCQPSSPSSRGKLSAQGAGGTGLPRSPAGLA